MLFAVYSVHKTAKITCDTFTVGNGSTLPLHRHSPKLTRSDEILEHSGRFEDVFTHYTFKTYVPNGKEVVVAQASFVKHQTYQRYGPGRTVPHKF